MSAVITPFEGTELFNTASFNNRISQINTGFSYVSNPNLLDNWYFGNPVNQRGQTEYTSDGYTVDRWALVSTGAGSFILHGSDNYSADVKGTFYQRSENERFIVGAKYTLSVLRGPITSPTLYHDTFDLTASNGWKSRFNVDGGTFGFYYGKNTSDIQFDLDDTKTLIAAKLELGSTQTLAHQDANGNWALNEIPDFGEQLRRCQRYCRVYKAEEYLPCLAYAESEGWYLSASMYIGNMRTTPTNNLGSGLSCSVSNIGGGTSFDKTIMNWGVVGSTIQRLRINGGDTTPGPFPYNVMPKQDLIFSADL